MPPDLLTRLARRVVRGLFRFRAYGADRVPPAGPALVVANHVSYVDWLLVWAACGRRPTFVLPAAVAAHPLFRLVARPVAGRLIPIDGRPGRPHAHADALQRVADALDDGRLVVMFPEGRLTLNGQVAGFGRGVERVLRRVREPVAVVPAYLDNLWGSAFGLGRGRVFGRPAGWRRRVAVQFGPPLPTSATAAELRAAVVEAGAECAIAESDALPPPPSAFIRTACRKPGVFRTAVVDTAGGPDRALTWGRLLAAVWSLARWLEPRVGGRPRVGVWLPTGLGGMLANVALGFVGRAVVNLNYTAGPDAVRSALRQADIDTVVTSRRFLARVPFEPPPGVRCVHLEDALADVPKWRTALRYLAVVALPGWAVDRLIRPAERRPDDPLTVIFSSGSTGDPKGVVLSHRNIAANVEAFARGVELGPADRVLGVLPFFHSFGYTVCLWAPLVAGMSAVLHPDPRAAHLVGELCRRHRCTILLSTATFLRYYLRRCEPADFRSLRLLICGAEKLPVPLADEFHARFGVRPVEGYGCTETAPVVGTNLHDVRIGERVQKADTPGTVGRPLPGVAVAALDPDTLARNPPGVDGELAVRGPNVMPGYLNDPARTAAAFAPGGWYRTGDVGRVEADGFVRVTGRLARFAKSAGEMIPLERVEEELHDALAAAGDRLVAVVAVPCGRRGERVAVLHLPAVADRLPLAVEKLRARGLPSLWLPDLRDCWPVESLPVLGSGKLDLRALSEMAKLKAAG